ncbi:metal-dependent hydrolase [Methanobrevibacter ruminantium]|uniref:metal-dependent hydrolase n=1 Tax=Methanobrevibacter ruminantium TaxID=83816 RepID=UPI0026EB0B58|nr:metal-dependent hydrolase [Methanobrevibacter ruminantium]
MIFAFILSLFMFYDPLAIALAVISANIPDFDHEFKRNHVITIIALGALISLFLYFLGLPYYLGLVIILLGGMFLVSSHRGFTHSILGAFLITVFLSLFLFFGMGLSSYDLDLNNSRNLMILLILIIALALLFLNKRLSPIFLVAIAILVVSVNMGFISLLKINLTLLAFSIFFGLCSHIVLDSFTPSGVKAFSPFRDKEYHKKFGVLLFLILIMMFILLFPNKLLFYLNFLGIFH